MREVARRARVTHAAPYHHFADRGAIIAGLVEEGFTLLTTEMAAAVKKESPGTLSRFESCGRAYFRFATRHRAYFRLMFRPELANTDAHPAVDDAAMAAMQVLVRCVAECQNAGTMPPGDPMPIVLTSWATMHGLSSLWLDGPLCRVYRASSPQALGGMVATTLGSLLQAANAQSR
jgi:AcrR family transcriptional regulator